MKTLYYTLLAGLLLIVASCKSLDKLVEEGRYDDAIVLATKKLAGKKKKKTKHIKALEEAFLKINAHDLAQLHRLSAIAEDDGSAWISAFDYAVRIDSRQHTVSPFLPLVSKDNYEGYFELINVDPYLAESRAGAAAYLYAKGSETLSAALENDDRVLAKQAHYTFGLIGRYYEDYKDVDELLVESHLAGITYVLMNVNDFDVDGVLYVKLHERMSRLGNEWTEYHIEPLDNITYDLISDVEITDIYVSPESEDVRIFTETRELERWLPERDDDGEILRDTLGNEIQYREVEIVRATLSEIFRTKQTSLSAKVWVTDFTLGTVLDTEDFSHEVSFESDACNIEGDRRALSAETEKRVDSSLRPFPTDYDMIDEALENISGSIIRYLNKWQT